MSTLFRLLTIVRTAVKYRLDTLFQGPGKPWPLRLMASFSAVLPAPRESRGVRLRRALEELGPIFVKFGQLLSTRPDLVPADICRELNKLQDAVPPFSVDEFVAIVERALERSVEDLFLKFDREPLASASVAGKPKAVVAGVSCPAVSSRTATLLSVAVTKTPAFGAAVK